MWLLQHNCTSYWHYRQFNSVVLVHVVLSTLSFSQIGFQRHDCCIQREICNSTGYYCILQESTLRNIYKKGVRGCRKKSGYHLFRGENYGVIPNAGRIYDKCFENRALSKFGWDVMSLMKIVWKSNIPPKLLKSNETNNGINKIAQISRLRYFTQSVPGSSQFTKQIGGTRNRMWRIDIMNTLCYWGFVVYKSKTPPCLW